MSHTLQHRGKVDHITNDKVFVRVEKQTACAGCHAKGLCGEKGEERIMEVTTPYASTFEVGESVIVALVNRSMGWSSVAWGYIFPLVVLLVVLFGVKALGAEDGIAAVTSIVAIAIYYAVLYALRSKFEKRIQFTIIKE
ncbi:MAG: SoxR reducing system RseC family protein [Alistipes sp.]|nr:SoxR reducing system RseC family protein [Alistipes sp.]MBR3827496.1 SoxR reducing system RseC family protein [Alistipes sp.]